MSNVQLVVQQKFERLILVTDSIDHMFLRNHLPLAWSVELMPGRAMFGSVRPAIGINESYHQPMREIAQYTEQACVSQADCIVVGNNLGQGLRWVSAIPEDQRHKVIVFWNDNSSMNERPDYEALGVTRFGTRSQQTKMVAEYIESL